MIAYDEKPVEQGHQPDAANPRQVLGLLIARTGYANR